MLVSYLKINSEFFEDTPPPRRKWRSWVEDGLVDGKVIDNQIYINRSHFASNPGSSKSRIYQHHIAMDSEFQLLLKENGILEAVIRSLDAAGCVKVNLMAHWFTEKEEITTLLESIDASKGNLAQRAALRYVSAKSIELSSRALKRSVQGLGEEALDEPLPPRTTEGPTQPCQYPIQMGRSGQSENSMRCTACANQAIFPELSTLDDSNRQGQNLGAITEGNCPKATADQRQPLHFHWSGG